MCLGEWQEKGEAVVPITLPDPLITVQGICCYINYK